SASATRHNPIRMMTSGGPALQATCRPGRCPQPTGTAPASGVRDVTWYSRSMDDAPRTRLQPRAVRMIHRLRVTVEDGPDRGTASAPEDGAPLAIGTSEDNALVLTDPAVSRYHLELRRTSAGVQLADLGSRNGTWFGGVRVERAVVPAGTRLRLGDTTIVVEE